MLAEAGFGETTRGAVPLSGGGEDAGPAPMILQTGSADQAGQLTADRADALRALL